ncbi:MAG: MBL fold metallo-hydrolase [Deltaproteobacteria bacterium]|nr:MBL fold metallo-hydrolase [Deltaproteobacteria bacterium]
MQIKPFFDPATSTLTYVVFDEGTRDAVIIDPVLDYDPAASKTATKSIDEVDAFVRASGLTVRWVLETHAHADHLSASQILKRRFGAKVAIGARITEVQKVFKGVFDLEGFPTDGSQFDRLLTDGDVLQVGSMTVKILATPGHTPACLSFSIGDAVFTGDALFVDDYGTGRTDFPAGSADELYRSVHDVLYALPDETRVFVGHDYQPGGRELRWQTTIGSAKRNNIQLKAETTREEYVKFRTTRDATLSAPKLLLPSVQVNIAAGRLPKKHANGRRYLSLPIAAVPELEEDERISPRAEARGSDALAKPAAGGLA